MAIIRRPSAQPSEARWDPFEMMREMFQWDPGQPLGRGGPLGEFAPSFEVKETNDAFIFTADLPGVKQEDLEVSLTGNRLTVSGKRESEKRDEADTYYMYERSYGSFSRAFTLPREADVDQCDAQLRDGVLTLRLPKKSEAQPRRIDVRKSGEKDKGSAKA
jgi:HSP20 family protein